MLRSVVDFVIGHTSSVEPGLEKRVARLEQRVAENRRRLDALELKARVKAAKRDPK